MKQKECTNERKRTKKRFSTWMACLMAVVIAAAALPFTALATEQAGSSTADAGKGSVTITNPKDGVTYYGYKIFDVTYTTVDDAKSYSYSISGTSQWFTIVKNYADDTGNGLTLVKAAGTDAYVVTVTDGTFSAADFANHLKTNVGSNTADFTLGPVGEGESELETGENLPLGYYFVLSKNGGDTQALCNLTTTDPNAEIKDKNDTPFKKEITAIDEESVTGQDENGNDVQVGAKITYTITGEVPDTSGAATYYYHAKDTMSKGLTFNKDVTVKIGTQTVTPTVVTDSIDASSSNQIRYIDPSDANGGGFELSLDLLEKSGDNYKYTSGDAITVTYTATVNKDAVSVISENNAELKFGTDPDNLSDSTPQVVKTLSSEIIIDKFKKGAKDSKLPGAKFVLKRGSGDNAEYYKGTFSEAGSTDPDKLEKVEWVKSADVGGASNVPDLTTSGITVVTTDDTGAAVFAGLANGTYELLEVEAPAGYNLLKDPIEVKINAEIDPTSTTNALKTGEGYTTQQVTAEVENSDGSFLPSTGGMGTTLFYVCGIALMLAAAVFFVMKKRAGAEKK